MSGDRFGISSGIDQRGGTRCAHLCKSPRNATKVMKKRVRKKFGGIASEYALSLSLSVQPKNNVMAVETKSRKKKTTKKKKTKGRRTGKAERRASSGPHPCVSAQAPARIGTPSHDRAGGWKRGVDGDAGERERASMATVLDTRERL